MEKRSFLKKAGASLAGAAIATPALSQQAAGGLPEVTWRMALSWPKSFDTAFGASELIAKRCAAATGGKFNIKLFPAG